MVSINFENVNIKYKILYAPEFRKLPEYNIVILWGKVLTCVIIYINILCKMSKKRKRRCYAYTHTHTRIRTRAHIHIGNGNGIIVE